MAIVTRASAGMRAATRATILQLRAPQSTARAIEDEASNLVPLSPVPVVVSSRCDIALAAGAAGVNLPESDITVEAARSLMGERLVGRSVHSLHAALRPGGGRPDFVIFGPVGANARHPDSLSPRIDAL